MLARGVVVLSMRGTGSTEAWVAGVHLSVGRAKNTDAATSQSRMSKNSLASHNFQMSHWIHSAVKDLSDIM